MLKIKQLSCYGFVKIHLTRLKPAQIKIDPFIRLLNSNVPTERIPTPEKVSGCIICTEITRIMSNKTLKSKTNYKKPIRTNRPYTNDKVKEEKKPFNKASN